MQIIIDTREKAPLTFRDVKGVSISKETLSVGDYTARHTDGNLDDTVIERKSIADLFHSFTHEYQNEKEKIKRAHEKELKFILAIEGSVIDVRRGYEYWKDGMQQEVKKSGLSQVRQIMTIQRKYRIEVWWCTNRYEMAFRIMEYFLAYERIKKDVKDKSPVLSLTYSQESDTDNVSTS